MRPSLRRVSALKAGVGLLGNFFSGFCLLPQLVGALYYLAARSGIYLVVHCLGCGFHAACLLQFGLDQRRVDVHQCVTGFDHVPFIDIEGHHAAWQFA